MPGDRKRSDQGPRQSSLREVGLRGGLVLVDDPTQHVATADVAERPGSRGHCAGRCGHLESKAAVRPMLVVVPDVVAKDGFEMTTAENERPVETLFSYGPYPVGCKLRIPTPRNTKIALTGSGCQEVSKRASSVIRWERAGNGFDVTRRGIAGIAPNSKRPDGSGRFGQAAIEYSRRTPPSRSIRWIRTEPSSRFSETLGIGT